MGKVRLNEDREIVARVKEGLKRKEGYCPCRLDIIHPANNENADSRLIRSEAITGSVFFCATICSV